MIKRLFLRAVQRLGYHVVADAALDSRSQTAFCRHLFDTLGVDFVIDVGGYRGQYRAFIRDAVGFTGRGVSFEPVPEFAEAARHAAQHDSLWTIENFALGAAAGQGAFNVMVGGDFSSFRAPRHDAFSGFREANAIADRIGVTIRRLDDVFGELQHRYAFRHAFLKLDTQGFDLEVLRGAAESLPEIVAIQTELSWVPLYRDMPRGTDVVEFLDARGFHLAGMYRTGPTGYPTSMLESDAYFARTFAAA